MGLGHVVKSNVRGVPVAFSGTLHHFVKRFKRSELYMSDLHRVLLHKRYGLLKLKASVSDVPNFRRPPASRC